MTRVVVVGGGITGLSAAYELTRHHEASGRPGLEVVVVEATGRIGGKVRTAAFAGHPVDCGADAFLARVPEAVELCRELGLADQLVSPATRRAYLYSRGALRAFPEGTVLGVPTDLDALERSGVVSATGLSRAAADLTMGGEPLVGDTTVGALVRGRLGDEVFERLVAPLLGGVNAGDADQLSVEAGAPQLAAAVREQPSLIAGLRAQLAAATTDPAAPVFFALPSGTQTLTDALAGAITDRGGSIRTDLPVRSLRREGSAFLLECADGTTVEADGLVLATPDFVTAGLLEPLAAEVARELAEVDYASVAMVALALPRAAVGIELDGSGFLVARDEGLLLTACSWASSKWAHLVDPEVVLLRASAGHAADQRALELDDAELVEALVADLTTTMALSGAPVASRVSRYPRSLPQFRPGHLDRVGRWRRQLAESCRGLVTAGAGHEGLGLPACIRQGRSAARDLVVSLGA